MRTFLACLIVVALCAVSSTLAATSDVQQKLYERALIPGETFGDIPIRAADAGLRSDSTWYGQHELIGDEYYAIPFDNKAEGSWTFDRGAGPFSPPAPYIDDGEGWWAIDQTANEDTYFRVIDETLDLGPGVPPPIIGGDQSLWVGIDKPQADSLCYECGAGYGNNWLQRCTSEPLSYNGTGDVTLSFLYWCFVEPCYEGIQIYLKRADGSELLLNPYPGSCPNNSNYEGGSFTDSIGHYTNPETYTDIITEAEIGEAQDIRIIFEFSSDGGWSDQDCDFMSIWGPFSADNVSISGGGIDEYYDFETGMQGWEPGLGTPIGSYAGIADFGCYTILDPCACRMSGNILELHDGLCNDGFHPEEQHERVLSPICVLDDNPNKNIFMELDMYALLPHQDGVLMRPGWLYYPYTCSVSGAVGWSPRVGQTAHFYMGEDGICGTFRYGGTRIGSGTPVPPDAEMVIALIDLVASCAEFSIDPCSGNSNFSPIYDNITVCVTDAISAPTLVSDTGTMLQDAGSFPSNLLDPRAPGPANVTIDRNMGTPPGTAIDYCGDTLVVVGPQPSSDPNTRWEARMWWRVAQRAPLQNDIQQGGESRYKIWKERVSDGRLIDRPYRPEFTFGWMDSVQVGTIATRNKFKAAFREDDDDFVGEEMEESEMIWDDVLYPGSKIEYFMTSNYIGTPNQLFYLPDTTGGFFYEFEVLPGLRTAHVPDCGGTGFHYCVFQPATLYLDAYGRGGQIFIENALATILNGADPCITPDGCELPARPNWDRYDYGDACSCWNAPFARGSVAGSNNGMTLNQILGYRTILVNTGTLGAGNMQEADFPLFDAWLTVPDCDSNVNRQVFVMNGDKCGQVLEEPGESYNNYGLAFMNDKLGATHFCDSFNGDTADPDCGDENQSYCVRLLPSDGGSFSTETDVDAFGNYCPNLYGFNVLGLNGGVGNRYYYAEDGLKEMSYAQVTNEDLGPDANYRSVLSCPSWHHMTVRDGDGSGMDRCPRDLPSVVAAGVAEIGAALKWGFDVVDNESIPKLTSTKDLAQCQSTWLGPSDVDESASSIQINRLYQNQPNPFNPLTLIRFSLARTGPVEIAIYGVNGRLVRTLIDGKMEAGSHSVTWDGTNDLGNRVGSGIYWSQMRAGSYISNKKVVVLK